MSNGHLCLTGATRDAGLCPIIKTIKAGRSGRNFRREIMIINVWREKHKSLSYFIVLKFIEPYVLWFANTSIFVKHLCLF